MCNQTVGLVQAELEQRGITTVSLTLMRDVTAKMGTPRALFVPWWFGFSMGEPHNPRLQRQVIDRALSLLPRTDLPVLEDFATG